jgi:hypothetical protein
MDPIFEEGIPRAASDPAPFYNTFRSSRMTASPGAWPNRSRRFLDGDNQLTKIILGVRFADGMEVERPRYVQWWDLSEMADLWQLTALGLVVGYFVVDTLALLTDPFILFNERILAVK